jgi:hypothetical protein
MTKFWAVPLLLTVAATAAAQEPSAAVTKEQVKTYQASIEGGCRDAGVKGGNPADKVNAFCSCVIATLRENVPFSEWQSAFYHWKLHENDQEQKILAPYMGMMGVCKKAL